MLHIIKRFSFWARIDAFYRHYAEFMLLGLLTAIPLKLSLAYAFLFPLLFSGSISLIYQQKLLSIIRGYNALKIFYAFLTVILLAAPFGIEPLRTFGRASALISYSFSIVIFIDLLPRINIPRALTCLLAAQAFAGIHSIYEFFTPTAKQVYIGTISESGQIAMTFPLFLGLLLLNRQQKFLSNRNLLALSVIGALIFIALLLNLKRGPWAGVLIASLTLATLVRCRLCLLVLFLAITPIFFFEPLQQRILQSSEHFFISGGRNEIWNIGTDLLNTYPLGIGYSNSSFLQKFSLTIPPELKHFHNNFLNIFVETGVLGITLFVLFIITLLKEAWSRRANILVATAGAALLSNQIAGIVEYNLGDSEVMLLAYLVIALILSPLRTSTR